MPDILRLVSILLSASLVDFRVAIDIHHRQTGDVRLRPLDPANTVGPIAFPVVADPDSFVKRFLGVFLRGAGCSSRSGSLV